MSAVRELPPEILACLSWWQRQRYLRRLNEGSRPPDKVDRSTFTADEMRAANRSYDRWYRGKGPELDEREADAYRAYKRLQRQALLVPARECAE